MSENNDSSSTDESNPQRPPAESRPPCQTLVFFDIETSGLAESDRITEMSLVAVHRDELLNSPNRKPRVLNKLCVCVYPMKNIPYIVEQLTGLSNVNLEKQMDFNSDLVQLIRLFLLRLHPPVCLIAHNGNRFDFPRLLREIEAAITAPDGEARGLAPDLLCADSLHLFREFEPVDESEMDTPPQSPNVGASAPDSASSPSGSPTKKSFKLADIFQRRTGSPPRVCHCAEDDCVTVMALVQMGGPAMVEWIDSHAQELSQFSGIIKPLPVKTGDSRFPCQR